MAMIKSIIISLFLIIPFLGFTQTGRIEGRIINRETSKPVSFVNIYLQNTRLGAATDVDGNFVFEKIPAGVYDIHISHIEYGDTILKSVRVVADSTIRLDFEFPLYCKYKQTINNKTCPICHSKKQVVPIYYGLPSEGLIKLVKENKARLGGCMISNCMPHWYCLKDSLEF